MSRPAPWPVTGHSIGVVGGPWRARVSPGGALLADDGSVLLDWWVAAEDRWRESADRDAFPARPGPLCGYCDVVRDCPTGIDALSGVLPTAWESLDRWEAEEADASD